MLVALVLALFLAAALVMPRDDNSKTESLRSFFDEDGRWALLMLAAFNICALLANLTFWQQSILSLDAALNAMLRSICYRDVRRPPPCAGGNHCRLRCNDDPVDHPALTKPPIAARMSVLQIERR